MRYLAACDQCSSSYLGYDPYKAKHWANAHEAHTGHHVHIEEHPSDEVYP